MSAGSLAAPRALMPPALRLARAGALAVVAVGLAAAGHLAAGGPLTPYGVVLGLLGMLVLTLPLVGTEIGPGRILVALAAGQALTHLLFSLTGAMNTGKPMPLTGAALVRASGGLCGPGGHDGGADALSSLTAGVPPATGGTPGRGLGMLAAHLLATLVATWWLRAVERRAWLLLRRGLARAAVAARALVDAILAVLPSVRRPALPSRPVRLPAAVPRPMHDLLAVPALTRRGPPRARLVLA